MPSSEKSEHVHGVFSKISGSYDLMNDLESLGLHRLWKARLVRELSKESPQQILDVACGTGDIAIALSKANPQAEVIGLDFNASMLEVARRRVATEVPLSFVVEFEEDDAETGCCTAEVDLLADGSAENEPAEVDLLADGSQTARGEAKKAAPQAAASVVSTVHLIEADALDLPFKDNTFDAVSISFGLRNMPDYGATLAQIYRVLKPGGVFRCLEASYPTNKVVKPPFKLYFKYWLPALGKLVVNSPEEYSWLNTSTEAFLGKDELAQLMRHTGFVQVDYSSYLLGAAALHRGTKQAY